jgi:hypothetical protein
MTVIILERIESTRNKRQSVQTNWFYSIFRIFLEFRLTNTIRFNFTTARLKGKFRIEVTPNFLNGPLCICSFHTWKNSILLDKTT